MKFLHELSPRDFEELCYHLLAIAEFKNLEWHGSGGGDRGRDITAAKVDSPLDGIEVSRKWVVQCRHMVRSSVSKAAVQDWLASCREHAPDDALLIVSSTLSSAMKDWLRAIRQEYRFAIHLWEEGDLKRQIEKHAIKLQKFFPQLERIGGKIDFYPMNSHEHTFACNEFDEAFILIWNAPSRKEARKWAQEFVAFIKTHDIQFLE